MRAILSAFWNTCAFFGLFALAGFFAASGVDLRHWYVTLGGAVGFAGCWKAFHFFEEVYRGRVRTSEKRLA